MNSEQELNVDLLVSALPEKAKELEREFRTYLRELPRLLLEREGGRFALIQGEEVVSIWDTSRDALQAGYERFGLERFAIQKVDHRELQKLLQMQAQLEKQRCQS